MTDRPSDLATWSDHHGDLTRALADLGRAVLHAFAVLNAIRYEAPWRSRGVSGLAQRRGAPNRHLQS